MKVKVIFAWYDLWIGLFWDKKKKWLYVFPVPMCGVVFKFEKAEKKFICYEIWRPNIPDNGCTTQCKECKDRQKYEEQVAKSVSDVGYFSDN